MTWIIYSLIGLIVVLGVFLLIGYLVFYRDKAKDYIRLEGDYSGLVSDYGVLEKDYGKLKRSIPGVVDKAVRGSRSAITGMVTERMVPFLPQFGYKSDDARFIGTPIDYIVFPGLSERKPTGVVLLEVKSGRGDLSVVQGKIRDLVEQKRVIWQEIREFEQETYYWVRVEHSLGLILVGPYRKIDEATLVTLHEQFQSGKVIELPTRDREVAMKYLGSGLF